MTSGDVTGPSSDGADSSDSGPVPEPVDCDAYPYQITPEQVASTPRPDRNAEIIAMLHSGQIVAPQDLYDMIHADLDAIRLENPSLQDHPADLPWGTGHPMYLAIDEEGRQMLDDGIYNAWDCANERYGVTELDPNGGLLGDGVYVYFPEDKLFHLQLVLEEYLDFPHVFYGETPMDGGFASDEYICFAPGRGQNRYLFGLLGRNSRGIEQWFDYDVDAAGVVTLVAEYQGLFPEQDWEPLCWREWGG